MSKMHFCFRRINPALVIDFLSVGTIQDGQFIPLDDDHHKALVSCLDKFGFGSFIHQDDISRDSYVYHDQVYRFLDVFPPDTLDWFQDTLIACITLDLTDYVASKEEE